MSDLWPFSSSCSPPIMHHSSPPIMHQSSHPQPPPPLSSPHLLPRPQVSSPHIPFLSSQKHFSYPHISTPPSVPQTQLPTPQHLPNTPTNCPHSVPQNQLSSCQNIPSSPLNSALIFPPPQDRSPHFFPPQGPFYNLSYPHFTPPPSVPQTQLPTLQNLPNSPVNSPQNVRYTPVNSPQNVRYTPVNSPLDFPSPQLSPPPLLSPSQHQLCFQNPDPTSDNPDWIRSELVAELPYSYSYQNQTIVHLDLQNQNQFSTGVSHHGDETENTHHHTHLANNHHTHLASGVYGQDQGAWRPTLSQLRCSPLGSRTGNVAPGCWSSADFNNQSPAEDFSGSQFFFHDINHDNYASQQPFCSPTTPGPSPHYPQTPAVCSPGPSPHYPQTPGVCSPGSQMHPSQERMEFPAQPSRQTLSCCFHDYDGYPVTSDPAQTTNQGQDVTGPARAPSLAAGPSLRDESGGGEDTQKEFKMKQPENISRLLCTVCKRDFRSLPALNGHMRCHSTSRPATCLNKSEDSSAPVQPCVSIVMPVSVPVQSRGRPKACRGGQKRCSRPSPATGGAVLLYRSLLHPEEEEARDGVVAGIHYTPPPMLCPLRAGPGLYCSLATGGQHRVQTVQLHNTHDGFNDGVAMETASPPPKTLIKKPRINEGRDFQAEIPPLRDRKHTASDSHNALLLWTQWDELERPVNQHRVEALLTMARSSVLPGGGTSPETALHVLSEFRGDFLLTVEKLLTPQTSNNSSAPQSLRERWSAAEKRLLVKSLQLHHKDFSRIQRNVQTKSLSQCVEFYYLWKKKLSLSARTPARLTITLPETDGQRLSRSPDAP